jgi:hypothetical protein
MTHSPADQKSQIAETPDPATWHVGDRAEINFGPTEGHVITITGFYTRPSDPPVECPEFDVNGVTYVVHPDMLRPVRGFPSRFVDQEIGA